MIFLKEGLSNPALKSRSISHLWSLGLGTVTSESLLKMNVIGDAGLVATVLIANLPQTFLSFLYLFYNKILTSMLLAREWSNYAHHRKGLRVSSPKDSQRSTYFLQLPYLYGVPLLVTFGILHWLVSQSIFLARVIVLNDAGEENKARSISTCGYSNIAIIFTLMLGLLLTLNIVAIGFRNYKSGIHLVSSCSAAISAACHAPETDVQASKKPVKWGSVPSLGFRGGNEHVGHCCYTSLAVHEPEEGKLYAGLH